MAGLAAPRQAQEMRRHAEALGFRYLYTVCAPEDAEDPTGYVLAFIAQMNVAAVVVFDLETADHSPARVCEVCDLVTVVPPETWSWVPTGDPGAHGFPDEPLSVAGAVRVMQQHLKCAVGRCPRKTSAYNRLVAAGHLKPPVTTPEDRARERGIPVDESGLPVAAHVFAHTA
ncbi:hypothetical protein [Nocardia sp. N2S4-5]|uniref:hypothetical protein n=1 Tax=Nocardia sp. N2S4-5 TaxID=3351565 RepID=UPI0037CFD7A4